MLDSLIVDNKEIKCASNALTPILYRQIFKKDFLKELSGFLALRGKKSEDYTEEDLNTVSERSEAFTRLAFVMAKQAEIEKASNLVKLTEIDFFEWLSGFEPLAFSAPDVVTNILRIWRGNSEDSNVESKN